MKIIDGAMGYYKQGKTRRGSCAVYMDVSHPDIIEFIKIRTLSGGDNSRKILNRMGVHIAVNITEEFRSAVDADTDWNLICPHTKQIKNTIKARELWELMLHTRELTGEPYMWFIDVANQHLPQTQMDLGLRNYGSNLCSEISLATSEERTAVCCLASLNLEKYDEWKDTTFVKDMIRFLDNVIQWFIDYSPKELSRARYSAMRERALGLGAMGWANFLMSKNIPFESGGFNSASQWNHIIFSNIQKQALEESLLLGELRGEAPDMIGTGRRNSHLIAPAPNSNSSILCNTSSALEPLASNAYTTKTRAGIFLVKNKHLIPILEKYNKNIEEVWKSIIDDEGSVQNLDFLSVQEKLVFKTAWEIDQIWVVEHAEQRQQYVCQSQSLNLYFLPGTERKYINRVHLKAMRGRKIKGLYYFRTGAKSSADTVKVIERSSLKNWDESDSSVCVACEA